MKTYQMDITRFESQASRIARATLILGDIEHICRTIEAGRGHPLAVTVGRLLLRQADAEEAVRELGTGYRQSGQPAGDDFHALVERRRHVGLRVEGAAQKAQEVRDNEDRLHLESADSVGCRSRPRGRCMSTPDLRPGDGLGLRRPW